MSGRGRAHKKITVVPRCSAFARRGRARKNNPLLSRDVRTRSRARFSARTKTKKNHLPVAARATLTRAVTATDALLLATRPLERAQVVQSQSFIIRRDDRRRETLRRSHRAHPERPASVPTRAQRERGHLRRVAVPSVVSRAFQPLARPRFAVAVAHRPSPRPQYFFPPRARPAPPFRAPRPRRAPSSSRRREALG